MPTSARSSTIYEMAAVPPPLLSAGRAPNALLVEPRRGETFGRLRLTGAPLLDAYALLWARRSAERNRLSCKLIPLLGPSSLCPATAGVSESVFPHGES